MIGKDWIPMGHKFIFFKLVQLKITIKKVLYEDEGRREFY